MATFEDVLNALREKSQNSAEQGALFERLMKAVLKQQPENGFEDVWLWKEWPGRPNTQQGRKDYGIDLVAKREGSKDYCAIQCKFYAKDHYLQKGEIDSFFTESGKTLFTSRLIVATTDKWSKAANAAVQGQQIPCSRLDFHALAQMPIDWDVHQPEKTKCNLNQKSLRSYQKEAFSKVIAGFKGADRGSLIMACGSGKTLTSLRIAEEQVALGGRILFLTPSIALTAQTLHEWAWERNAPQRYLAVCSDAQVHRKNTDDEDVQVDGIVIPPTTSAKDIATELEKNSPETRTVVFCTYQSLRTIHQAQAQGAPAFDLVICDEAHRTTGVEGSQFGQIHDSTFIKAKKRLYMTATPRIYTEAARKTAQERDSGVYSMDDAAQYGKEFYRLGFYEAIKLDCLSDYRVLVLAINEAHISKHMHSVMADGKEVGVDDYAKIVGCYDALKHHGEKEGASPLKRAVSFSGNIAHSKKIKDYFAEVMEGTPSHDRNFTCEVEHVDGTQSSLERAKKLDWLREEFLTEQKSHVCRILTNVRCLNEGVDAPSLDAVMFMSPRKSQVDVVQAVGRVMRRAEGKQYGYVILPVVVPAGMQPEEALDDNKTYAVVWEVLRALRSHDGRFDAMVNKLELNNTEPAEIRIIGVGFDERENETAATQIQGNIQGILDLEGYKKAFYATLVHKVGTRAYWGIWAQDIAKIYATLVLRINDLCQQNPLTQKGLDAFLRGLRSNINTGLSVEEGVSMLAQHLITQPVFDALFEDYAFSQENPVSQSMGTVVKMFKEQGLSVELEKMEGFYASVKQRVEGIDNPEGRQRVMIELYEKFFTIAFKKTAESLGIAYTPLELVDFVLASADEALHAEFGLRLTNQNVHVIDPFTGTGSFINRLIQNKGLLRTADLPRKYTEELHANDVLLLAYYLASINIEEAYHARMQGAYVPFPGAVLTDTFNLFERDGGFEAGGFAPENSARIARQRQGPITVVVGNPPWSVGQTSENDNNQNRAYSRLDSRIEATYATQGTATYKNALYDSYVRALRWASERIGKKGVIALVTNGGFLEGRSMDGLRTCLVREFDALWCLNLRGNIRRFSKTEGENVFGQASMAGVAITVLVKNPAKPRAAAELHYADIGDFLKRRQKLEKVQRAGHIGGSELAWRRIIPNAEGDWIHQRDPVFQTLIALGSKEVKAGKLTNPDTLFTLYSLGVSTNRDAWAYNFGREALATNMERMIAFYNTQVEGYAQTSGADPRPKVDAFIDTDPRKISWSRSLKQGVGRHKKAAFAAGCIRQGQYRPFTPQWLYFNRQFNDVVSRQFEIFPQANSQNMAICVSGVGAVQFSVLMTNIIPNLHFLNSSQCFPRWSYDRDGKRQCNIPNPALTKFKGHYGQPAISEDDLFYYVYGMLHSPVYRQRFANNLSKEMPRVPLAPNFGAFARAGRALAELHLNYQSAPQHSLQVLSAGQPILPATLTPEDLRVTKMRFNKEKTAIQYNTRISVVNIPAQALQYTVSGRSPLQWLVERWQVKTEKESGIVNDPNAWMPQNPRYILNLIGSLIHVGIESTKIIKGLPKEIGVEEKEGVATKNNGCA